MRRWPIVRALLLASIVGVAAVVVWLRPWERPALPADLTYPGFPQVAFADADHGYVLLGRCPTATCETWVGATDDGGRTWHGAMVPGLTYSDERPGEGLPVDLIVIDAEHVVLDDALPDDALLGGALPKDAGDGRRWYSGDAGRSWAEISPRSVGTVAEIPPDAFVQMWSSAPDRLSVQLVQRDGTTADLATAPEVPVRIGDVGDVRRAPDNSRWASLGAADTGESWLFGLRGRTWVNVPLPDGVELGLAGLTGYELADGGLVIVDPTADGPAYAISATGTTFEPADRSRLWPSPVKQLQDRESGYGLVGQGGTWTPLPFPVHPQ